LYRDDYDSQIDLLGGDEMGAASGMDAEPEELPGSTDPDWNIPGWTEYQLQQLGRRILNEVEAWFEAVAHRLGNMAQWRRHYEMMRTGEGGPWPDAADIPSEATYVACTNHTTRLNQQIVNANPPFTCVARDPEALDAAPRIEEAMAGVLEEADWTVAAAKVHGLLPRDGICFFRTTYEIEHRRKPKLDVDHDADLSQALLQQGMPAPDAMYEGLKKDDQGQVIRGVMFENEETFRGIRFKSIPFEDGILIPAHVRDWTQARGIGEVLMVSGEELRLGTKNRVYRKEAVDDLLRFDSDDPINVHADESRYERLEAQGIDLDETPEVVDDDPEKLFADYRCYHLCYRGDWNRDGELEWARILIHAESGAILKFQYLPWAHGEPEYVLFPYLDRPGELLGAGVAELVSGYQDAETAVLCQLIDHEDLQINLGSSLIVGRGAGMDIDKFVANLGKPFGIEGTVQEILPLPIQPLPPEHYNLLAVLKDKRDLITRSSNTSVGKEAPGTRTLGELQILTAAGNLQFEDAAGGVARTWGKVFDQIRWLVSQFGLNNGTVQYRKAAHPATQLTGDEEGTGAVPQAVAFDQIDAETLRAKVDIVPTGLAQLADLQSRIQQATFTWSFLGQQPEMQDPTLRLLVFDYVLTSYRVPIKDKILAAIRAFWARQMQAAAMAQSEAQMAGEQQQAAQGAEMDAQHAQAEAQLQAGMANEGLLPGPGEGAPMGPAGPMTAAQPPGNGRQPVGVI
jgi:hypothetical protein